MLIDEKWVSVIQADGLTSASLQEAKKEYNLQNMHLDRRIRLFQWNKSYSQKLFLFVCKIFSDYYNRFQEGFYYRFYLVDLYRKVRIGEYIFLRGFLW